MMTPELQEYFDTYLELFSSKGWGQLSEEVIQGISSLEKQTFLQDDEKVFHYNRGYAAALAYIMNYPDLVKQTYEDNMAEDEEDALI